MSTGHTSQRLRADEALVHVLEHTIREKVLENLQPTVEQAVKVAVQSAILVATQAPEAKVPDAKPKLARPTPGGRCAAVWDTLDKMSEKGALPSLSDVRKVAKRRRWNANNARIEYYQWRKFNGITRATSHA